MSTRILVVDDDEKHLQTTREILEFEGFDVVTHNSAFRTTEMVKQVSPDLVLLDVNMPGLSGDRLCSLLRANSVGQMLPILFYSSNDEDSLRKSVQQHGASGYVCKGDLSGLRRTVRRFAGL
jgi:DNA-binding response OmpR family regulator